MGTQSLCEYVDTWVLSRCGSTASGYCCGHCPCVPLRCQLLGRGLSHPSLLLPPTHTSTHAHARTCTPRTHAETHSCTHTHTHAPFGVGGVCLFVFLVLGRHRAAGGYAAATDARYRREPAGNLRDACCVTHAARCMLHVACCMLHTWFVLQIYVACRLYMLPNVCLYFR